MSAPEPPRRVSPTDATRQACCRRDSGGSSVEETRVAAAQTRAGRGKHPHRETLKSLRCRLLKNRDENCASRLQSAGGYRCAARRVRNISCDVPGKITCMFTLSTFEPFPPPERSLFSTS